MQSHNGQPMRAPLMGLRDARPIRDAGNGRPHLNNLDDPPDGYEAAHGGRRDRRCAEGQYGQPARYIQGQENTNRNIHDCMEIDL